MPPFDLWVRGRGDLRAWLIAVDAMNDHTLVPVNAKGSSAIAVYQPDTAGGEPSAFAIQVLDVVDGRISAIQSFIDPTLFNVFGLPDHPNSSRPHLDRRTAPDHGNSRSGPDVA